MGWSGMSGRLRRVHGTSAVKIIHFVCICSMSCQYLSYLSIVAALEAWCLALENRTAPAVFTGFLV